MKLGLFADPHYADMEDVGEGSPRRCRLALTRIRAAMERFVAEGVDAVVCLGDLTNGGNEDDRKDLAVVSAAIREYNVPFFLAPGNHDAQLFSPEEFEEITGFSFEPPPFTIGSTTLLVLNTNYTREGTPYIPHQVDWTDCSIAPGEIARLRETLNHAPGEVVLCMHALLLPCPWRGCDAANAPEVREILELSGKVKHVYSGHFHDGMEKELGGIAYHILPALCEHEVAPIVEI